MDDIQNLFKETIATFMKKCLEAELDEDLSYSKTARTRIQTIAETAAAARRCVPASEMWRYRFPGTERVNLGLKLLNIEPNQHQPGH